MINKISICFVLFLSNSLNGCEVCDYLKQRGTEVFLQINDRARALDIDDEYWALMGELDLIGKCAKIGWCEDEKGHSDD